MTEAGQRTLAGVANGDTTSRFLEMDLDREIIAAHRDCDLPRLAILYEQAADLALAEGDVRKGYYFLTQAWVFALDAGVPRADHLCHRLVVAGRAR